MSIAEKLTTIAENQQSVYDAGKQSEYDRFWDTYQQNGNQINYEKVFAGYPWTKEIFRPKYNMRPRVANDMFYYHNFDGTPYDLVEHLESLGVTLDFSNCAWLSGAFTYAGFSRVGVIDTRASTSVSSMFTNSPHLITIDKLILKDDGSQTFTAFTNTSKLENIIIEGVIGQPLNVSWSTKLTHDSLMSIINALQSGVTSKTLTIGTANLAKLTDAEKAIATEKGWTLA
jgi:hypothetical protein